jgi:hypothetical protein
MQAVGGSKGSNDQALTDLKDALLLAKDNANSKELSIVEPYLKAGLVEQVQLTLGRLTTDFTSGANVNFANNIRKDDDSLTPLMFVYEAVRHTWFCAQSI